MNWPECAVLFVVAAATTIMLVPLAKKLAIKLNAIDYPSARRINMLPIPRLGGVAMFGGICAALVVLLLGIQYAGWANPFVPHDGMDVNYLGVGCGVIFMFAVGVADDVFDLSPRAKMFGQIVAACIVVASGLLLSGVHNPLGRGYIEFGWAAYPITIFYLVAFANIINLIDGLDGLAAGITAISCGTIIVLAFLTGRLDAVVLGTVLVGACVGFLKSNFYPASIFMGDSGALMLGFSIGVVSLFAVARSALFVSLFVPILAAGVPILDTFFAIIRRKREHRPIDEADKGHIHHRLMRAGFSQRTTVLIMWAWTLLLAICAMVITKADGEIRIIVSIVAVAITAYVVVKLHLLGDALRHHFHPRQKPRPRNARESEQAHTSSEQAHAAPDSTHTSAEQDRAASGSTHTSAENRKE